MTTTDSETVVNVGVRKCRRWLPAVMAILACCQLVGCLAPVMTNPIEEIVASSVPRELEMMSYPRYRIEPPDILLIEVPRNLRPEDDPLVAGDELLVRVSNAFPVDPEDDPIENDFKIINNLYTIQPDGMLNLGPEYGAVLVEESTLAEAEEALINHLIEFVGLKEPKVWLTMPNNQGLQDIAGEHLVRPDGTVALGIYGHVYIQGMTLEEAQLNIEHHLAKHIHKPQVAVDVLAYNSQAYYIITDGGGFGEQISKVPCTGNETVLDAIAQIQGLSEISSKDIWVARPIPADAAHSQIMKVDWRAITEDGITATNYQIFPGDRVYVVADKLVAFDNKLSKLTTPFERIFGFTLLGNGTVRALQRGGNANNNLGF